MHYSIFKSNQLKIEYERTHNITFDKVMDIIANGKDYDQVVKDLANEKKIKPPKPNTYAIMGEKIEESIKYGVNRFEKQSNKMIKDKDLLIALIYSDIMRNLCEYFDFEN